MKILIFSQKYKEEDQPYLEELISSLEKYKNEIYIFSTYNKQLVENKLHFDIQGEVKDNAELKKVSPDLVITLGGDGTVLSVIDLVRDSGIPVLGINLGRLGFLSSVEKTKISTAVEGLMKGHFYTEDRALLELCCENYPLFTSLPYALNDFTLHKRDTSSMITIHTYVDGKFLNSYWADGLVVSTPTGSTGYSLSCGGPIIFPNSGNIVITPVAPHNLNVRPIVLSDTNKISFEIEGRSENFLCTLDSRYETVTSEHLISIKKADFKIRLAHPNDINFMKRIRGKLMWGTDKRNH